MCKIPILVMTLLASINICAQQFLPVEGIVNARDLGGYEVQGGLSVKTGKLIRAAHLADATDADIAYLESIPVALVVDFRTDMEMKGKADRDIPGAKYVHLPVDVSGSSRITAEEKNSLAGGQKFDVRDIVVYAAFNEKAQALVEAMYPTLFFNPDCQRQFASFFRMVLETEDGAVIYHCSQGKDRTGVASALLLAALGADRETIVADFDATNRVYEKDVKEYSQRVIANGGTEKELAVVKAFLGCNTENFIKALDAVEEQYGSLENYLKGPIGLSETDLETLRGRYLTETNSSNRINQ